MSPELLAVAVEPGGQQALFQVLAGLKRDLPLPVVVFYERPRGGEEELLQALWAQCPLPVREADDKDPLLAGQVLLCPAGYQLMVTRGACSLLPTPIPFSDPLSMFLTSVTDAYGDHALTLVLPRQASPLPDYLELLPGAP